MDRRILSFAITLLIVVVGMIIGSYLWTGGGTDEGITTEGTENPSYNTVEEVIQEETTQVVELPDSGGIRLD